MRSLRLTAFALLATANSLLVPSQQVFDGNHEESYHIRRYPFHSRSARDTLIELAQRHGGDIWTIGDSSVDIHFGPKLPAAFDKIIHDSQYIPKLNHFKPQPVSKSWNLTSLTSAYHEAFHEYDEISGFLEQLSEEFPEEIELIKLGRSYEGREVLGISISKRGKNHRKPRIVVQGAQHAREWIASSSALYFAHSLAVNGSETHSRNQLLDFVDVTIIPLPNPDGYQYTWSHDRLWYKNRVPVGGGKCKGIDLNRNWGYEWSPGIDDDPCSFWYPGAHPFEAAEVKAVAAYIERTPNIKAFIDLRSYGQLIMHPYSFSCDESPADEENLIEAALGAAKAYTKSHGTHMSAGAICDKLYSAPGNIVDWMYGEADIVLSYSVMLRDTGTHGFLIPPEWIRPVGEETSDLVEYLIGWVNKHHKL